VENLTSLHREHMSPRWQNSKLAPYCLKFLAHVGNRTQASVERIYIQHKSSTALVVLMAVYSTQKHYEEETSLGTWVSTNFLVEQGSRRGLNPLPLGASEQLTLQTAPPVLPFLKENVENPSAVWSLPKTTQFQKPPDNWWFCPGYVTRFITKDFVKTTRFL
jgi:hypothetical protein